MFDIGMTEMLIITVVTIIVVGPKELPGLVRNIAQYTTKLRGMANEFRTQLDDAVKDTGLDDIKSDIDDIRKANPANQLRNALNPLAEDFEKDFEDMASDEDFDDPAAEDDGEPDTWELQNTPSAENVTTPHNEAGRTGRKTQAAANKGDANDGANVTDTAASSGETSDTSATPSAAGTVIIEPGATAATDASAAANDSGNASEVKADMQTASKPANGLHPHGLSSDTEQPEKASV